MNKINEEGTLPQELSAEELDGVMGGLGDNANDYTPTVPAAGDFVTCPYYKSENPLKAKYCENGCTFRCVDGLRGKGIPDTLINREYWSWVVRQVR